MPMGLQQSASQAQILTRNLNVKTSNQIYNSAEALPGTATIKENLEDIYESPNLVVRGYNSIDDSIVQYDDEGQDILSNNQTI